LELIYQVAADSNLPKRNIALLSVLLHGLRAAKPQLLTEDYDGQRLTVRQAKADSIGKSRSAQAEIPSGWLPGMASYKVKYSPQSLFISHSRRNQGENQL